MQRGPRAQRRSVPWSGTWLLAAGLASGGCGPPTEPGPDAARVGAVVLERAPGCMDVVLWDPIEYCAEAVELAPTEITVRAGRVPAPTPRPEGEFGFEEVCWRRLAGRRIQWEILDCDLFESIRVGLVLRELDGAWSVEAVGYGAWGCIRAPNPYERVEVGQVVLDVRDGVLAFTVALEHRLWDYPIRQVQGVVDLSLPSEGEEPVLPLGRATRLVRS